MSSSNRIIHSRLSSRQIPDLLQAVFVSELVVPSSCLWLVSPWISDIVVINNNVNTFRYLNPAWSRSDIRLSQALFDLAESGTTIHVATRSAPHNVAMVERLKQQSQPSGIFIHIADELHEKGMLGDAFYIGGSMNFTFSGITLNEESVLYSTDSSLISERRIIFADRWGGSVN
jgi:hypothetical protein